MNFYTRSNGEAVDITTMKIFHLRAAVEKVNRMDPTNPELPAMRAELEKRDQEFAEQQAKDQMR